MKAIVCSTYGPPTALRLAEIDQPAAGDGEVLIRVHAASVNPLDWHLMRGRPYLLRLMSGLRQPKDSRVGRDVAGRVEAVGRNVTGFGPGDEVFGACRGACAEVACAAESALARKPENVTFEQAAAVPVAALTALQALRDTGRIQAGHRVLINGAAGGVGTFAVQLAKSFRAEVTGVCSTRNVELVRSLGADRVIDYAQEDFTRGGERYDLMLDAVGNHSLSACRRVLQPRGTYVLVGAPDGRWIGGIARFIQVQVLSPFVRKSLLAMMTKVSPDDLSLLRELLAAGKLRPVIDRSYELSEVPQAIAYLEEGHARGKVVITVGQHR
jgi:NADPH:quinone reductase-like Zn-dependent oxidoreductase